MLRRRRPGARGARRVQALCGAGVPARVVLYALILGTAAAVAQSINLDCGDGGSATGRIVQLVVLLTVITLAPSILVMVTSFVRIVGVLSLLRVALGTQSTPPNVEIGRASCRERVCQYV